MKKINYISTLFILALLAFAMNVTAQGTSFKRVDANPADGNWTGKYLIVYEAQAGSGTSGTYQGNTVLTFNSALTTTSTPVLDGAGNIIVLSPNTPGDPGDLATLTGGSVDKTDTEVTVTGGQIAWSEELDAAAVTIAATGGGWSIQTGSGYYLGSTGNNGNLGANETLNATTHVHTISIGDANSNVTQGVTFHNCAIILSSSGSGSAMRVNANTGRFGYWGIAAAPYYGQHPVALYKLDDGGVVEPFFSVDQTPKSVASEANSTATINVVSNVAWTASVVGEGASITSGSSGTGAGTVTVSFTENTSTNSREATLTISTADAGVATKSFDVKITQDGFLDPATESFVKVTTAPDNWEGEYLIVYEDAANANTAATIFNGGLLTGTEAGQIDATLNAIDVKITAGKIVADETAKASKFTITAVENGYSIMSASGNFIGNSGATNTIMAAPDFDLTNHTNTITISGNNAVISTVGNEGRALRYNSAAASKRFCFFTASSQQPVALYKLDNSGTGINLPKVQSDIKVYLVAGGNAIVESAAAIQSLTVVSITGAVLTREQFPNSGKTSCQINMQSFPAGVYIVNVETVEGTTAKKLIIN